MSPQKLFTFTVAALLALATAVQAKPTAGTPACVGGQCLRQIKVDPQRVGVLKNAAQKLQQAGVPAYASVYKTPFNGKRVDQGAILVAAVGNSSYSSWMEHVGKVSIGFVADKNTDSSGTGSGYLRIGNTYLTYNEIGNNWNSGRVGTDVTSNSYTLSNHTEATFLAEPGELNAFMGLYQARAHGLIVSPGPENAKIAGLSKEVMANIGSEGKKVAPEWNMTREGSGQSMKDLKTDACAGRASCAMNPNWRRLFAWNVKTRLNELRAYGQQNNIPELANLSADAPKQLDQFMRRYFGSSTQHSQSNDPHSMIRKNAIHSSMVTTFVENRSPMETLQFGLRAQKYKSERTGRVYPDQTSVQFYQPGQGQLYAIPDWKPGQKEADQAAFRQGNSNMYAPPRFDSERVSLQSFIQQLGQ
jgi:hypothetical protein